MTKKNKDKSSFCWTIFLYDFLQEKNTNQNKITKWIGGKMVDSDWHCVNIEVVNCWWRTNQGSIQMSLQCLANLVFEGTKLKRLKANWIQLKLQPIGTLFTHKRLCLSLNNRCLYSKGDLSVNKMKRRKLFFAAKQPKRRKNCLAVA